MQLSILLAVLAPLALAAVPGPPAVAFQTVSFADVFPTIPTIPDAYSTSCAMTLGGVSISENTLPAFDAAFAAAVAATVGVRAQSVSVGSARANDWGGPSSALETVDGLQVPFTVATPTAAAAQAVSEKISALETSQERLRAFFGALNAELGARGILPVTEAMLSFPPVTVSPQPAAGQKAAITRPPGPALPPGAPPPQTSRAAETILVAHALAAAVAFSAAAMFLV